MEYLEGIRLLVLIVAIGFGAGTFVGSQIRSWRIGQKLRKSWETHRTLSFSIALPEKFVGRNIQPIPLVGALQMIGLVNGIVNADLKIVVREMQYATVHGAFNSTLPCYGLSVFDQNGKAIGFAVMMCDHTSSWHWDPTECLRIAAEIVSFHDNPMPKRDKEWCLPQGAAQYV